MAQKNEKSFSQILLDAESSLNEQNAANTIQMLVDIIKPTASPKQIRAAFQLLCRIVSTPTYAPFFGANLVQTNLLSIKKLQIDPFFDYLYYLAKYAPFSLKGEFPRGLQKFAKESPIKMLIIINEFVQNTQHIKHPWDMLDNLFYAGETFIKSVPHEYLSLLSYCLKNVRNFAKGRISNCWDNGLNLLKQATDINIKKEAIAFLSQILDLGFVINQYPAQILTDCLDNEELRHLTVGLLLRAPPTQVKDSVSKLLNKIISSAHQENLASLVVYEIASLIELQPLFFKTKTWLNLPKDGPIIVFIKLLTNPENRTQLGNRDFSLPIMKKMTEQLSKEMLLAFASVIKRIPTLVSLMDDIVRQGILERLLSFNEDADDPECTQLIFTIFSLISNTVYTDELLRFADVAIGIVEQRGELGGMAIKSLIGLCKHDKVVQYLRKGSVRKLLETISSEEPALKKSADSLRSRLRSQQH